MMKKSLALIALVTLFTGCTRQVFLQSVPCEKDCGCPLLAAEPPCPEMETRTIKYQIYETAPVVQKTTSCAKTTTKRCTTTCRQVQTN